MADLRTKHYVESIYYDIELTARLMKFLGIQVFNKFGIDISPDEHATLDTIFCHPEICQRDLAKLILKDRANTGKILNSLEEKKLITRTVDVKNNRLVKRMIITDEGNKKLEEINEKIKVHYLQKVSCQFTNEDMNKLQETIRAFRSQLEELVNINI